MMETMEEELTCPICLCLYEEPQLLSCGHCLCRNCLKGVVQSSRAASTQAAPYSIKCPFCRKLSRMTGDTRPKDNFLMKIVIEKYIKIKEAPKPTVCPVHCEQPLNIYCSSDKKLICGFCATSREHKVHVLASLGDAYNQEKICLQELLSRFEKGRDALSNLETKKARGLQDLSDESDMVTAYFENLQHMLEQKKNQILSDCESEEDAVKQGYERDIDKLKAMMNEEEKALNMAKDLERVSDPFLFLQKIKEVQQQVSYATQVALPSVSSVPVTSSLTDIDMSVWDNKTLADMDTLFWPPKYPEKKKNMKMPSSFWAVCAGILLLTLIGAVLFTGSSSDRLLNLFDSEHPVFSSPSDSTGTNAAQISFYMRMIAEEIVHVGESCLDHVKGLTAQVAEFVSTFAWLNAKKEKLLLLGMEEKRVPASEPTKPFVKKEKQTSNLCPTNVTTKSFVTREIQTQNRDLELIRFTEHQLLFHEHVHALSFYISCAVGKAAEKISAYWWIVIQEMHHIRERCETYILTFIERAAEFIKR